MSLKQKWNENTSANTNTSLAPFQCYSNQSDKAACTGASGAKSVQYKYNTQIQNALIQHSGPSIIWIA